MPRKLPNELVEFKDWLVKTARLSGGTAATYTSAVSRCLRGHGDIVPNTTALGRYTAGLADTQRRTFLSAWEQFRAYRRGVGAGEVAVLQASAQDLPPKAAFHYFFEKLGPSMLSRLLWSGVLVREDQIIFITDQPVRKSVPLDMREARPHFDELLAWSWGEDAPEAPQRAFFLPKKPFSFDGLTPRQITLLATELRTEDLQIATNSGTNDLFLALFEDRERIAPEDFIAFVESMQENTPQLIGLFARTTAEIAAAIEEAAAPQMPMLPPVKPPPSPGFIPLEDLLSRNKETMAAKLARKREQWEKENAEEAKQMQEG